MANVSTNVNANYGGKLANDTAYIKYFNPGDSSDLWQVKNYKYNSSKIQVLTPSSKNYNSVYIPGNLFVDGSIVSPSDINLKDNIVEISSELSDNIMSLKPMQFTFKADNKGQVHYGFIAQEFETYFPELVSSKQENQSMHNVKAINYLEIIPLLVGKLQKMQTEIDELKRQLQNK